jgi:hypothetical protein
VAGVCELWFIRKREKKKLQGRHRPEITLLCHTQQARQIIIPFTISLKPQCTHTCQLAGLFGMTRGSPAQNCCLLFTVIDKFQGGELMSNANV